MTTSLGPQIPEMIAREDLSGAQRDELFALLARYFEGVTRPQFERDLEEKNWVVEVKKDGALVGFSTLLVEERVYRKQPITVVYSGDTIVAPEAWGSPALARSWIAAVNRLREEGPSRPCYWLLLTSGFRTYRFLPVFWREFFPCCERPTPSESQTLLDSLARERYGRSYHSTTGIVRFPQPQRLRGALGRVPAGREADRHVKFFLERNPGHAAGDELVCLTELSDGNLTLAGRRMVSPPK